MINRSVARRYAKALMDLVEADPAPVADKLAQFNQIIETNPILKEVLTSPAFRQQERRRVLDQILKRLGWGKPLDRFMDYLVEHRRVVLLSAIVESFTAMLDEQAGRVRVQVSSAFALDKSAQAGLKTALAGVLKKEVVLLTGTEPELLAGVKVKIGDLLIDGSLKTQLDNLADVLIQQPA